MTEFILVDAGSLQILYKNAKKKGLDALLATGRKVVVTKASYDEIWHGPRATTVLRGRMVHRAVHEEDCHERKK